MDLTMGMRCSSASHWRTHHWPKMLVTNTPVSSIRASMTSTPRPGHWPSSCRLDDSVSGSTARGKKTDDASGGGAISAIQPIMRPQSGAAPSATAQARVAARPGHVFPVSLVDSQFATLESPAGEPGVLTLDAGLPLSTLAQQTCAWLALQEVA